MSILASYLEMLESLACQHVFVPSNCLYHVMSCCFKFESCNVLEPCSILCNEECLSVCALSEMHCHSKLEPSCA
jgi:hypothetical protein